MKKMYLMLMLVPLGLLTFAQTETQIGSTNYDLQSKNNSVYLYPDGTIGAVWTQGSDVDAFIDRGTGYNYFDGTAWGEIPTTRIDSSRTGWPSYAPADSGEIVAAHHNSIGIIISKRDTLGEGEWTTILIPEPDSTAELSWPKIVSSGEDRMNIHLLTGTYNPYEGLNSAILYYRSLDAGLTWDSIPTIIEGMTSEEYVGFSTEAYSWAEPMDSSIAFVVADTWNDLFIMRSDDNGDTWEKTIVWQHPYPMWDRDTTATFFAPDGTASLAFDNDGMLHLAFGIIRTSATNDTVSGDTAAITRSPFTNAIAYWNETMPTWLNDSLANLQTLNPGNLETSGNLVAWVQDVNENDTLDFVGNSGSNLGAYGLGLVSMPQLAIDEENQIFLVYSGVAEGYDNGTQMFRHIWVRTSIDGGTTWGAFTDLTVEAGDPESENVFPVIAAKTDDNIHIVFQSDAEPGLSQFGGEDDPTDNSIIHLSVPKSMLVSTKVIYKPGFSLSQNYPNPFNGYTNFNLSVEKVSRVTVRIHDITGRLVLQLPEKTYSAGSYTIPVNAQRLTRGLYTYTFTVNGKSVSNKMIVK